MPKTMTMESLPDLLDQSSKARAESDWAKLEDISIQVLRLAYKGFPVDQQSLKSVIQSYLGAIVGTGDFLVDLKSQNSSRYQEGVLLI